MGIFDFRFLRMKRRNIGAEITITLPTQPAYVSQPKPHLINTHRGFIANRNPSNLRFTPDARRAAPFNSFGGADAFAKKFVVEHLGDKPHYAILVGA